MKPLRLLPLLALATSLLSAAWSQPEPGQLGRLERTLASWHGQYNPAEQMVRRPFSSPGYHTTLTGGFVHPTRDSLNYALGLLDTGKPEHLERAVAIVRRVVALQDTDPARRTYGIWSWFMEEPLDKMSPPDWNWADFNGVTLLQIARDHRGRLPADLARAVEASIVHAARSIRKRNVGPHYTNIAIMGTYVTLVAGELLDLPEFRQYGLERLQRFHAYTLENGSFEEYNSPTYTVIALLELSRLQAHVQAPAARPLIDELVRRAWTEIATHFHAPTRQWGGPHSRAYSPLNSNSALALIQRGTAGRVGFGLDAPDREELRLPVACPPDLEPLFRSLPEPRTVTQTFIRRTHTVGTTYLHPDYALGSINYGDLWNQRRALILYFGTAEKPGYMRLRLLKNDYDFASAFLTSAQREGRLAGAVTFITNGGDTHISLAKVKDAKFRARDLRLRFEIGGPAMDAVRVELRGGSEALVQAGSLPIAVGLVRANFGERTAGFTAGGDEKLKWLDVVLHEGAEREFDLAALTEAIVGFTLAAGSATPEPATGTVTRDRLEVSAGGVSVTAPVRPAPRS
jgi:hypothetical protein